MKKMLKRSEKAEVEEDEDDRETDELQILLDSYIKRSRELEQRENRVLRQMELIQSAVASLQAWNEGRRASAGSKESSDAAPPHANDIEEETRLIREETERIRKEVEQKKEENKRLEEQMSSKGAEGERHSDGSPKKGRETRGARRKIQNPEPGLEFFNEKLRRLRELNRKVRRESEVKLEEGRRKEKHLMEKIKRLEREALITREIVTGFKKYPRTKKK